jgi:hypothetical protein
VLSALLSLQTVSLTDQQRVKIGRAVAVENTLRIAGGPGGVAQRRGGVFIEHRPVILAVLLRDQVFVGLRLFGHAAHVLPIGHGNETLDIRQRRRQIMHQVGEGDVEEQHAAFGMVENVLDLLGKQPGIDGVQHRADARHREIKLEMTMGVPGECGDTVAGLDAHGEQCLGHLLGAMRQSPVVAADDRLLACLRNDLRVRMVAPRMFKHA